MEAIFIMGKKWTDKEIQYLHDMYCVYPASELALQLDRSYYSIKMKLEKENLRLPASIVASRHNIGDVCGSNNHNWKGGISKDNYHYKKLQKERYPEKILARESVYAAINNHTLVRMPCEKCGCLDVQAHHDDYSQPLNVRWLCKRHHDEWHRTNTPNYSGYIGNK